MPVTCGALVAVGVGVAVGVRVNVAVGVTEGVTVLVGRPVWVDVAVAVAVMVAVGVRVGVAIEVAVVWLHHNLVFLSIVKVQLKKGSFSILDLICLSLQGQGNTGTRAAHPKSDNLSFHLMSLLAIGTNLHLLQNRLVEGLPTLIE